MADHVYKVIEVVGSSTEGTDAAVRRAVEQAGRSVRNMRWLEVLETRAHLEGEAIAHWQVRVRIGFTLESSTA